MQERDQSEGNYYGDAVGIKCGVWNASYRTFDHAGQQRLAHPTQSKTGYGNSQLNAVHHFVQIAVQLLDNAGTDATSFDELLDARIAHAHQSKFGCSEESVGCYQEENQKYPEQHKCNHGSLILTFQRP